MLNNIIASANDFNIIFKDNKIPCNDIKEQFLNLIDNAYFAPSYIIADEFSIQNNFKKDILIELTYDNVREFKGYAFEKLLLCIKPKYNWLTFYRYFGGKYQGKCLNLNLSKKTTDFYKFIKKYIEEKNEN